MCVCNAIRRGLEEKSFVECRLSTREIYNMFSFLRERERERPFDGIHSVGDTTVRYPCVCVCVQQRSDEKCQASHRERSTTTTFKKDEEKKKTTTRTTTMKKKGGRKNDDDLCDSLV